MNKYEISAMILMSGLFYAILTGLDKWPLVWGGIIAAFALIVKGVNS